MQYSYLPGLRPCRIMSDATQVQLSEVTGFSQASISRIESCQRRASTLGTLVLAEALGVPPESLVDGVE